MKSTPTASRAPRRRLAPRMLGSLLGALLLTGLPIALLGAVGPAAPAQAATHAVVIKQYAYSPATLTIAQGDTVTWTNEDSVQHDVMATAGPATFHSPMLSKGQSWSFRFTTAGSYSYVCSVHPDMVGSVTVRPPATPTPDHSASHATNDPAQPADSAGAGVAATHPTAPATRRPKRASGQKAVASSPAPAPVVAAPETTAQVGAPATSARTLDPLLIVAGVSAAVMVFCLLLMTSRPVARPADEPPPPPERESTASD